MRVVSCRRPHIGSWILNKAVPVRHLYLRQRLRVDHGIFRDDLVLE
jgi:hypothetical protein